MTPTIERIAELQDWRMPHPFVRCHRCYKGIKAAESWAISVFGNDRNYWLHGTYHQQCAAESAADARLVRDGTEGIARGLAALHGIERAAHE